MDISNQSEMIWKNDTQFTMMIWRHESYKQILIDTKEFDNIQIFER